MLRLFFLGAGLASIVGGSAAAHEPDRRYEERSWHGERGFAEGWSGRAHGPRPGRLHEAPPWSRHYAYQASASRMWSSYSRAEWSYREAEYHDGYRYGDEYGYGRPDYRDCRRCGPGFDATGADIRLRPGPVYVDRRPVYIEQPPVYIEQPPIHVVSPPIYVEGPPVYVESPPVYVEPPVVHLTPSTVHVAPPEVGVSPDAEIVHEAPPPPTTTTHFGDLPPPDNVPPVAPPPAHRYRQEPGERG